MKIIYLADTASIHTRKWVKYFIDEGAEVICISFSDVQLPGTRHYTIDAKFDPKLPGSKLWQKINYLKNFLKIRKIVHSEKPDILHAHYASSYGLLGSLCNYHPFIISLWGSDIYQFPRKSIITKKILEANLKKADVICSTSQIMAREAALYTDKKVYVTPFGVDTQIFSPPEKPAGEIIIGTVKGLEAIYGIDILIKAFKIISEKFPAVKLRIVGTGSKEDEYKSLVQTLELSDKVEFTGKISHQEVPAYLKEFYLFIALSYSESFGVAVVEALSCGIPAIVSDIGGLSEVVLNNENGFCVTPGSPEAAAAAIEKLLNDPDLYKKFSENARQHVLDNYDWTENAGRMREIYLDLTHPLNPPLLL
jgi:glycosyltransferase involved in cell wall biosynthesis